LHAGEARAPRAIVFPMSTSPPPAPAGSRRGRLAALLAILVLALALRLFLAPTPGFVSDVAIDKGWAKSAAELGFVHSYYEQVGGNLLPDYPPLGVGAYALVGKIHAWLVAPARPSEVEIDQRLFKAPGIVFDLATCVLLWALLRHARGERAGLAAALVYALHPAVVYESAVWGQSDALFTFFVAAALYAHVRGRDLLVPPLFALGLLCKAQAIAFAPLVLLLLVRRPRALVTGTLAAIAVVLVVAIPFLGNPAALAAVVRSYTTSVGRYPALSLNAYNLWWALYADAAIGKLDSDLLFGVVSCRTAGIALFAAASAGILASLAPSLLARERRDRVTCLAPFFAAALIASAFHLLPTEMHERYMFPAMALGLPLVALGRRGAVLYTLSSLGFLLNLLGVLPFGPLDRALFAEFPMLEVVVALSQLVVFVATWRCVLDAQRAAGLRLVQLVPAGAAEAAAPRAVS
jgi:dolichyl-phosphate-mannose-protein mannosyltransferase